MAFRIWPRNFSAWCGNVFLECIEIGHWDGMNLRSHIWESMRIVITSGWFWKVAALHKWDACLNCWKIVHRGDICRETRRSWKWLIRQRSYIFWRSVLMVFCWADPIFCRYKRVKICKWPQQRKSSVMRIKIVIIPTIERMKMQMSSRQGLHQMDFMTSPTAWAHSLWAH